MKIVGTKFCGHDSAICVLDFSQESIFAMSTERVTRIKHDTMDISPILENYDLHYVDYVAHSYSDFEDKGHDGELREKMTHTKGIEKALRRIIKPQYIADLAITKKEKKKRIYKAIFDDFDAFKSYYIAKFKRAITIENPEKNKRAFSGFILRNFHNFGLFPKKVFFHDHHLCHAIPSYFLSPFNGQKAIALTLDGQGDGFFSKAFLFSESQEYELIGESKADFLGKDDWYLSIGRIYNYFTKAMDLRANSDEGKVEALAAFGKPDMEFLQLLKSTSKINTETMSIDYDNGKILPFYNLAWLKRQREKIGDENFCSVVQTYLEDTVVEYLNAIYEKYQCSNLCLSGGVAANIIMSLNIYERTNFKNIYVLPPMGDEGLAIGSAILSAIDLGLDIGWLRNYEMPYFGDSIARSSVIEASKEFHNIEIKDFQDSWPEAAAALVANGKICAIVQGKMEFGPRALGNRSIIANPGIESIRDRINSN